MFSFVVLVCVQAAEGRQEELTQRGAKEKRELELRIEEMEEKEQVLQARIEALQADNDFTNERLAALQGTEHTRTYAGVLPPVQHTCRGFQELCENTPLDTLTFSQHLSALVVCHGYFQCG